MKTRKKKISIFDDLMDGIQDAIKFRAGKPTKLRVTAVVPARSKPSKIK